MDSITFNKLNDESFEKLVRNLALDKFGMAGKVFPAGPDAGRDFSFEGSLKGYEAQGWDGYLVLQAKFKKNPKGTGDAEWLIGQLETELKKYKKIDSSYRHPKFYIIATNVNLSGADSGSGDNKKKGGLTKVEEYLETWKSEIGLIDYDIWSSEKIETLLTTSEDVRKTFSAWITPSDILNALLSKIEGDSKDLSHALTTSLLHGLKKDKNVRLKDAGCVSEDQIRSSQVFVDLPIASTDKKKKYLLAELIELSKGIYKPSLNSEAPQQYKNKIVVLGGPGQGKSTASLFLAQIFRGAFLTSDSTNLLDTPAKDLINEIKYRSSEENIEFEVPNRYPFYISLPHYADRISESRLRLQTAPSIIKHIAQQLALVSDHDITVSNVREWLRKLPWLIVFDGLDEVPPSGERANIIEAVDNFLTEAYSLDSDIFVVATSRPQGYNSDLDPEEWKHWKLVDLDEQTALKYAKLLTLAYYKDDFDRQKKIENQLELSVKNETTKRLMTSPLQVTILHMIVDIGGGAPSSRWNLFNEYFEILKKRERSKLGATQQAFDKNLQFIGPIHQRAGLLLHSAAEQAGQATSHMDFSRFSNLIRKYLESEEFSDSDIKERVEELCELSLHRLVLLSSREEGKVSFDVRSLQEFMAASALTSSAPETIISRLEYLGGKSHWQHVLSIAASRCFSEDSLHHTRLAITGLPRLLDDQKHYKLLGRGSQLSLNLFLDGVAQDHPKYRRQLALYALELLNQGLDSLTYPLVNLCDNHTEDVVLSEITEKYLTAYNPSVRAAAWSLLLDLAYRGNRKAVHFIGTKWPALNSKILEIVQFGVFPKDIPSLMKKTGAAILTSSFTDICTKHFDIINEFDSMSEEQTQRGSAAVKTLQFLKAYSPDCFTAGVLTSNPIIHHRFKSITAFQEVDLLCIEAESHPEWIFIAACTSFSHNPSVETLANCVSLCRSSCFSEQVLSVLVEFVPWPISSLIENISSLPESIEKDILMGDYGNISDWKEAEKRLSLHGATKKDYIYSFNSVTFDKNIASIGVPLCGNFVRRSITASMQFELNELLELLDAAKNLDHKKEIVKILRMYVMSQYGLRELSDEQVWNIIVILNEFDDLGLRPESFFRLFENHWTLEKLAIISKSSTKIIYALASTDREAINKFNTSKLSALISIDEANKLLIGLLCLCRIVSRKNLTISKDVLETYYDDLDPNVYFYAATLLFLDYSLPESDYIKVVSQAYKDDSLVRSCVAILRLMLESGLLSPSTEISLCTFIISELCEHHPGRAHSFKTLLNSKLDAEQSNLGDLNVWEMLKLPEDAFE